MKNIIRLLIVAFLIASVTEVRSEQNPYPGQQVRSLKQTTAGCTPSSTFAWLNINNARVRVNAGGDMWWDLPGGSGSKYYIPSNGSATSLFAGSLWIAGLDINNQLKCSAVRFRQGPDLNGGNDFWTGPLTVDGTASIDAATCMEYDKMYNITRAEVDDFIAHCKNGIPQVSDEWQIPANITNWPAHGDPTRKMSYYLAPFYDRDEDGNYDPTQGDYPYYDITNVLCHKKTPTMEEVREGSVHGSILADQVIKGDQTIWWVFNDKGNAHTETGGAAIGMEIRAQAFAFATNDEINNMTFYSYEIINRSTYTLTNTYFSPWTDVDLGYARDDYVGCDVARGLGYGYNGKNVDGNGETEAYGANPPAVGVDFFQGPYMDPDGVDNLKYDKYDTIGYTVHGIDTTWNIIYGEQLCDESINGVNFGNGIIDDERFGMRRFVYHNNDNTNNGDPKDAAEYYLYLRGIWRNGAKMEFGGTAVPGQTGTVGPKCDFMFPYDSDPCNWGTGGLQPGGGFNVNGKYWSEETGNNGKPNTPADRRFMQSAGPFTLKAGAVNYITFGVPWARATTGSAWASVELLRKVDDKCQSMFDNCFKVLDGPDAPDLTIRELDRHLIIYISNSEGSNNYKEKYYEIDPNIPAKDDETGAEYDNAYHFEGYQIYQLANSEVSVDQLDDATKARLIFQCDVKNDVSRIINFILNEDLGYSVPTLMVDGGNNGITHTFVVSLDQFSQNSDPNLVNHHTYYFMAVAYAYNNYLEYDPETTEGKGQKKCYLAGRKNIKLYEATPHKIVNGTVINSSYGDQPVINRWTGIGNGGNRIEMSDADMEELMTRPIASASNKFGHDTYPVIYHPTYKRGFGPVNVKIIDPLNVLPTDYAIWFDNFQTVEISNVTSDATIYGNKAKKKVFKWVLKDLETDSLEYADTTSVMSNEQIFLERGLSVNIEQCWNIGTYSVGSQGGLPGSSDAKTVYATLANNNGMITSSVTYADSSNRWLSGIRDSDVTADSPLNWIRAGSYNDNVNIANNDYNITQSMQKPYDPDGVYEKIAEGTWAPYFLSYPDPDDAPGPGPMYDANCHEDTIFTRLGSIDIVLTADKSRWTRCVVVEMCPDPNLSENGAAQFAMRKAPSVDKNGNKAAETYEDALALTPSNDPESPRYIQPYGMGWFPGYAIDIETGARLNMVFSEDSYLASLNGRDMMFNPPELQESSANGGSLLGDPVIFNQIDGTPLFGGKHYVYIFQMLRHINVTNLVDYWMPAYDGGKVIHEMLSSIDVMVKPKPYRVTFWKLPAWVGMPMPVKGREWLQDKNPVKISIRLARPYNTGYSTMPLEVSTPELVDNVNHKGLKPYYTFSTKGYNPSLNNAAKGESDLDLIQVVPNPYYAYANYEPNALTHKVKITNLPDQCVVTIYTVNGTKIRQFKKDSQVTSIEWDLTNHANTPIASGIYIIHVKDNVNGGEQTVKFYCAMRQVDLNTF